MGVLKMIERKYLGLKGRMYFLRLVKNPNNTHAIIRMSDALKKSTPPELIAQFMEKAYDDPKLDEAFQQKYWPYMPAFDELKKMPVGTFGNEFAQFITKWNLDKDIFPRPNFSTKSDYLLSRIYQAHDAWHVLTGYNPVIEDELALQAFGVGQYKQPISLLIISGGLLHILEKSPARAMEALSAISSGFERGKQAHNLLTSPLIERFADPIEEVRRDLGI